MELIRALLALLMAVSVLLGALGAAADDRTPLRRVLHHPPGRIRAEAGLEGHVEAVADMWSKVAPRVAKALHAETQLSVEVVLLSGSTFRAWAGPMIPEWGIGLASWPDGPITLDVDGIARGRKTLGEVLAHELSHVYLGQRLSHVGVPRWFVEGVAQAQSGEWRFQDTAALVRAAVTGQLPQLSRIGASFPRGGSTAELAYRVSLRAVTHIDRKLLEHGGFVALIDRAAESGRFDQAFLELTGTTLHEFSIEFEEDLRGDYGWISVLGSSWSLWGFMTFLFMVGTTRAYLKRRRRLAEMELEEAAWEEEPPGGGPI